MSMRTLLLGGGAGGGAGAGAGITISSGGGSGTTDQVTKFTGATAIGDSTIADTGSLVTINSASADVDLTVNTDTAVSLNSNAGLFAGVGGLGLMRLASNAAAIHAGPPAIGATANATYAHFRIQQTGSVTVAGATTSAIVASLWIDEPDITATGTVSDAYTLYISGAPTEGTRQGALWVDAGAARFDGMVGIGVVTPAYTLDVRGANGTVVIGANTVVANDILYYATGTVTGSVYAYLSAVNATGTLAAEFINANTATGASKFKVGVGTGSTGDAYAQFQIAGAQSWSIGIDNSDGDKLRISPFDTPSDSAVGLNITPLLNVGMNTTTFGTSANTVFAIKTGVAPSTVPADVLQIFSEDISAGNACLAIFQEAAVSASVAVASTDKIPVRVNGVTYYLLATTVP